MKKHKREPYEQEWETRLSKFLAKEPSRDIQVSVRLPTEEELEEWWELIWSKSRRTLSIEDKAKL